MSFRAYRLVEDLGEIVFPDLAMVRRNLGLDGETTAMGFSVPRLRKTRRIRELLNYPPESFGGEVVYLIPL